GTWEPARVIYVPGAADLGTIGHQVLVLPDGTLVDLFTEDKFANEGRRKDSVASVLRSTDKGQTWSLPVRIATIPTFSVTDPDTGALVNNSSSHSPNYDVAVDRNNGNLYAVWEDNGFSNGEYSSIAFSMSADGGFTW